LISSHSTGSFHSANKTFPDRLTIGALIYDASLRVYANRLSMTETHLEESFEALQPAPIYEQFASGWSFFLPPSFKASYTFACGDTFYDSPLGYEVWREALQHITTCLQVILAKGSSSQSPGTVEFLVHHPDAARSKLLDGRKYSGTQADFVELLRGGFWMGTHHSEL
jgi:hypothetical protein